MTGRRVLRLRTTVAVGLYRRTNGRIAGKAAGLPVLLLTVAGRTSGLPRTTPLIYFQDGESIVLLGSAFGATRDPDWVKNLAAADGARIQVKDRICPVSAREAVGAERAKLWREVISPSLPSIEHHQQASGRLFPVYVLTPS